MSPVEKYISQFEPAVQERLHAIRQLFFEVNPGTEESIRYNMPAFTTGKSHLYFAAYKKHIGFYPVYGLPEIEIAPYRAKGTKDSLHFPHNAPLPTALIRRIIRLKMEK
ncbi:DUF1801 domain-containing protein [uncultured Chitinophaga sp.]|uniref:iron chaperone n=1 Tax=Chitinophaga sp. TaxID=1869181 RepID=UPI00345A3EAE